MKGDSKMRFVVLLVCISAISCLTICATFANNSEGTEYKEENMLPDHRRGFTDLAKAMLRYASEEAIKLNHEEIDTEHILLGLVHKEQGIAARTLQDMGVDLKRLEMEIRRMMQSSSPPIPEGIKRKPGLSRGASDAIQLAQEEAQKTEDAKAGSEHLLLGVARERHSMAARVLAGFGVTEEKVRKALRPISSSTKAKKELEKGLNMKDFQDGSRDATELIQHNLNMAAKSDGEVFLPAGRYRLDGTLTIPPGVMLSGTWRAPHHAQLSAGTVLLAYNGRGQEDGTPLISLSPSSGISGLTIFYPEQTIEDVQPYPWTIQGRGMHNSVTDVTLVNPYKGIDIGTYHNELHYLRNIFGCPLKMGVYINNCTDIGRIENVHFNPHYWSRDEGDGESRPEMGKLIDYLLTEGEAFVFGRTDWEYVLNTFCYGYKIGYHFIGTKEGACNGNFIGIGADGTQNAIVVKKAAPYGLLITNGEFVSMRAEDPVEIIVEAGNEGVVQLNNCAFWGPSNQIARIEGEGLVSFVQCNFVQWDHAKKGLTAIESNGGSLTVQNCVFPREGKHISLGPDQRSAVIFGNQSKGGLNVENESDGDVQIGFNVKN